MNVRWLWGNYLDPDWRLTPQQRREVHRIARRRYLNKFHLILSMLVLIVIAVTLMQSRRFLEAALISWKVPQPFHVSAAAVSLVVAFVASLTYGFVYVRPVRSALRDLGYDVCVQCGYWLRGLDDEVKKCPECGSPREDVA